VHDDAGVNVVVRAKVELGVAGVAMLMVDICSAVVYGTSH